MGLRKSLFGLVAGMMLVVSLVSGLRPGVLETLA